MVKRIVTEFGGWLWLLAALAGAVVHGGTALLRVDTFFPTPRLLDFSGFYVAGAAARMGVPPYAISAEIQTQIQQSANIPFNFIPIFNPPFTPWILQPLSLVSYPVAATLWTLLMLLLLLLCTKWLAEIADITHWIGKLILYGLVVSYGPVFLNLTLGQITIPLLMLGIWIGRNFHAKRHSIWNAIAVALATGLKLTPFGWSGAFFLLRGWRLLVLTIAFVLAALFMPFALRSEMVAGYWQETLTGRIGSAVSQPALDDQSINAFVNRLGQAHRYTISGLNLAEKQVVRWDLPWELTGTQIQVISLGLLGLLQLPILWIVWRGHDVVQPEPFFYAWLLFTLLLLPHTARYNHALLLPAMAWLWGQGGAGRKIAIAAYALTALARLNHLLALALPSMLVPLALGVGLAGAVGLYLGVCWLISAEIE